MSLTPCAVDVSNNNHIASLQVLKHELVQAGYDLQVVIYKVSEGTTFIDPEASFFVAQAKLLGLRTVAYHYLNGANPEGEAQLAMKLANQYGADGLMCDWERASTSLPPTPTANVLRFMAEVERAQYDKLKILYLANWVLGFPGCAYDTGLERWGWASPDHYVHNTEVLLWQNPSGFFHSSFGDLDIDVADGVTPSLFDLLNGPAMTLDLYRVACTDNAGQPLAAKFLALCTPTFMAVSWWIQDQGLYDLLADPPFSIPAYAPVPVAAFKSAVLLGDIPKESGWAWDTKSFLYALSGSATVDLGGLWTTVNNLLAAVNHTDQVVGNLQAIGQGVQRAYKVVDL